QANMASAPTTPSADRRFIHASTRGWSCRRIEPQSPTPAPSGRGLQARWTDEARAALLRALFREDISVSIGQLAVTAHPAFTSAFRRASHPSVVLCANMTTAIPLG